MMLTFAVAAEFCRMVIGGGAAAEIVFFGTASAHLWLSACHGNKAICLVLVALGHIALTMKQFTILWLMVMKKPN
jgi:hypothetical protein